MNNNGKTHILYGQDGRMLKFSWDENPSNHNESNAPVRYRLELEDGVELAEVYRPGQRNVVMEAIL